jgi:MoaA/NifB/PqqE/SkfB family radical SAM enzyme
MRSRPLYLLPFDHSGAEQLEWSGPGAELTFAAPLAQGFRCAHDALHRVEVYIEPTFHAKRCQVWLQLFAGDVTRRRGGQRGTPLRVAGPLASEQLAAHGWIGFEFSPVAASAGKVFTFVLEAPDATPGNALAFRRAAREAGAAARPGRENPGPALLFRAVCLRAPELWPNFARFRACMLAGAARSTVDYRPLLARIEVSRPCNLHCVMCLRGLHPFDARREGTAFMTLPVFRALDPILPELLWLIAFGLGEPFLNPHYLELLRHARARNRHLHVFTSTNGTCLADDTLDAIVGENLLSTLQVSLDGATAGTFEAIRPKAQFATVLHTIERAAARRARARDSGLKLRAAMLVMRQNAGEVYAFIQRMAALGVDLISLDTPKGEAFRGLRADAPREMAAIFEQVARGHALLAGSGTQLDGPLLSELHAWQRGRGREHELPRWGFDECARLRRTPEGTSGGAGPACPVPWESFNLAADGEVRLCCNSHRALGRTPAQSIASVWETDTGFGQARRELLTGELHAHCRTCRAENVAVPGQLTPPSYLDGGVVNGGGTAALARLVGLRLVAPGLPRDARFAVAIESICRAAEEAAGGAAGDWRVRGWVSGPLQGAPLVVLAIDGVVRALLAPRTRAAAPAEWSALIEDVAGPLSPARVMVLLADRRAGLRLSRPALTPALRLRLPRGRPIARCAPDAPLTGVIDRHARERGLLLLAGWARDAGTRAPASGVAALAGGKAIAFARPMLDRPDVARAHGDAETRFGFSLEVPLVAAAAAGPEALTIVAFNVRGDCVALHWAIPRPAAAPECQDGCGLETRPAA